MNKKMASLLLAGVATIALSGCSVKQVDPVITRAEMVPGTGNLWFFCHGDTLIYYSNWGASTNDEYEFIVYGGCAPDVPEQDGVQNLPDEEN